MENNKNVWLVSTDERSRLGYLTKKGKEVYKDLRLFDTLMPNILDSENQHIYITSDEEIKKGDWCIYKTGEIIQYLVKLNTDNLKKIILTTDQDLIKDGVQKINDEFLEWFVKNPSCEEVAVGTWSNLAKQGNLYHIIIPKEEQKQHLIDMMRGDEELGLYEEPKQEKPVQVKGGDNVIFPSSTTITFKPKQETLEEIVREYYPDENQCIKRIAFRRGYTECKEKMYSEEDMKQFAWECVANFLSNNVNEVEMALVEVIIDRNSKQFEKFKKK